MKFNKVIVSNKKTEEIVDIFCIKDDIIPMLLVEKFNIDNTYQAEIIQVDDIMESNDRLRALKLIES